MADELTPNERGLLEAWQPMQPPADFVDRVVIARTVRRRLVPVALAASVLAAAAIALVVLPRASQDKMAAPEAVTKRESDRAEQQAQVAMVEPTVAADAGLNVVPTVTPSSTADVSIEAGENAVIHASDGVAVVEFRFPFCPTVGSVEIDRALPFRSPIGATGTGAASLRLGSGTWSYRVTCAGAPSQSVQGRVSVIRDAGTRALPKDPPVNPIEADGRTYRISYQSKIPTIEIRIDAPGTLHLASKGREATFETTTTTVRIPGSKLTEGQYTYWTDTQKPRKASTLIIQFDLTAPQVYIAKPIDGEGPWSSEVEVAGIALPGWSASVDGIRLPLDDGRFMAKVLPPQTRALAIRFTHPQRGTHYYLRRP